MKKKLLSLTLGLMSVMSANSLMAQTLFGLTTNNEIFTMTNASTPSVINGPYTVSGVDTAQTLVAIDFRAGNGMLYALGYDTAHHRGMIYKIAGSGNTWSATAVNTVPITMFLGSANSVGFDFVPTLDNRIRVIGTSGVNYAINADDATLANTGSSNIAFTSTDTNAYTIAAVGATAYTNSYYGADGANEIGYDMNHNAFVMFSGANYYYYNNPANYPTQVSTMGFSGLVLDANEGVGMDAWYDTAMHNSSIWLSATPLLATGAHLYKMDDATMLAMDMGGIGAGNMHVRDIAWQIDRDTIAPAMRGNLVTALSLNMRNLIFFDDQNPTYIRHLVRISNVTGGQAIVGIAYNFAGALYGLGYNAVAKLYQLYTIDTASGMAHAVNTSTTATLDLGDDHSLYSNSANLNVGFNFIGNTNIIRVIGKNGMTNVRMDAATGNIIEVDSPITYMTGDANFGQTANISSISWLNNYNSNDSDMTTMYAYDANTGAIVNLNNTTSGYGTISTMQNLDAVLNIFGTNGMYRNGYMDIGYNGTTNTSTGYMINNYYGDSAATNNYSAFYVMNNMTANTNMNLGSASRIGGGTPVKSVAAMRTAHNTAVNNVIASTTHVQAYPNPTSNTTRIKLNSVATGTVHVSLAGIDGRLINVYEFPSGTSYFDLSLSTLPAGLYNALIAQQGQADQTIKIVKN